MGDSNDILKEERNEAWRAELRQTMKNKERTSLERVHMTEADHHTRTQSNIEVNRGLTAEEAMAEARRCLDCPDPTCMTGCPVEIKIPKFIKRIERGEFREAAKALKETSPPCCLRAQRHKKNSAKLNVSIQKR